MKSRPGAVPLSELKHYQIRPHNSPERVSERGDFYIRDGWTRYHLDEHHRDGMQCCYLIDFTDGDDDRSVVFALTWSPLREKIIELVLRGGSPVGPCRLVSRPLFPTMNIWSIVGYDDAGMPYDPMQSTPEPETIDPTAHTV